MNKISNIIVVIGALIIVYFIVQKNLSPHTIAHTKIKNIEDLRPELEEIFNIKTESFPEEGVLKINIARKDIKVLSHDWQLDPFMGLSSWIAFQAGTKKNIDIMAMGDLVLFEDEVNIAINTAIDNGIQVT